MVDKSLGPAVIAGTPAGFPVVVPLPLRLRLVGFPGEPDVRLGEVRPAPRWTADLAGSRLPEFRDVLLQVQNPEFYLRESIVIIIDKTFESLVRRYHP